MSFQLDTSGSVLRPHPTPEDLSGAWASTPVQWSDLSPFTQGYIEAVLRSVRKGCDHCEGRGEVGGWLGQTAESGGYYSEPCEDCVPAFSDLAPETLAQIIADCEARLAQYSVSRDGAEDIERGRRFFNRRQEGWREANGFTPQTIQLCDDGKVRFAQ